MKFKVTLASNWICESVAEIEIKTLEDLKKLQEKNNNNALIVDFESNKITIHDSFIE